MWWRNLSEMMEKLQIIQPNSLWGSPSIEKNKNLNKFEKNIFAILNKRGNKNTSTHRPISENSRIFVVQLP